jgi:hypothetical protein
MIQTLEDWLERQDVVHVRAIKQGEEDKFILTLGQYNVSPMTFDSQKEAEDFLTEHFKFNNFELSIIGAMCSLLRDLEIQDELKNSKKEEK